LGLPEVRVEEVKELEKEVSEFSEMSHAAPEKVKWLENNKRLSQKADRKPA